jgi:ABC-type phosphonate transport system ATPase subunit
MSDPRVPIRGNVLYRVMDKACQDAIAEAEAELRVALDQKWRLVAEVERLRAIEAAAEFVVRAYSLGARKRYAALDTAIPALRAALLAAPPEASE